MTKNAKIKCKNGYDYWLIWTLQDAQSQNENNDIGS